MKIAIVKLSALGDIVHAMVALQFIKQQYPDSQIDWIVEENFAEILRNNPDIDHILTVNLKALKKQKTLIFQQINRVQTFAENQYDWVIDTQGLIKSALTARLIATRNKTRIAGFDRHSIRESLASWLYHVKINSAYHANTIDRNATMLSRPLGFAISHQQIIDKQPFLFFRDENSLIYDYLSKQQANIVLVIGSTWDSRIYPVDRLVNVAVALQQNCLVVWGNRQEKNNADWMATQSRWIKVMPELTLNDLKALIAHADLVIGNDTGPTHMAWGLNRPSITLFGPTPTSRVYQTSINRVIKSASPVNPYRLNRQDFSIREIDEQLVIEQAKSLLLL